MNRLQGKVALISGAARGMGAEQARQFVAEGAQVVLGDVLDEPGSAVAQSLGESAHYVHLDVTSEESWAHAVEEAVATYGSLNVLVNNAGVADLGAIGEFSLERWHRVHDVNVTGPFIGITAAAPYLKQSAPSAIVNVSSLNGLIGGIAQHAYTASKFGLRGLTKSVAAEFGPDNVRSNSVHPGIIRTDMTAAMDYSALPIPLSRAGDVREVASLVLFLASDESSYCTGAEFVVDGGTFNTMPPL